MKPQARIQAIIDLLEKMEDSRIPMDGVVGDYMRVRRYVGSKDRANIAERIYNLVRHKGRLYWWLGHMNAEVIPRNLVLAYLMLCEGADGKRLNDMFDGSKYAPEPLSDQEKALISKINGQDLNHADMDISTRVECPDLYQTSLKTYFGDDFEAEMSAIIEGASLDLRVNTFLCDMKKAEDYLKAAGVETDPTPYSPWGLRCRGKAYLAKTKAFAKGWVEIQDEGSQLIAHMCGAKPGMQVLDYCAGAGGKTLALAAAMQRKGRIVAMDIDERRLAKGKDRFKKAQVSDIIEMRALSETRHKKWLRRQKGSFDIVLCDVPCTGVGTWRRNPDMRWRTYGPDLAALVEMQAEILDKVASVVKPGGKLVYATCSLLPEENEKQIEGFLEKNPDYCVHPVPAELGNPYMRLTPRRHGTDGFFAAVLTKNA